MANPAKTERNKELQEKRKLGWSLRKIASHFNIHHSTVDDILKRLDNVSGDKESYTQM